MSTKDSKVLDMVEPVLSDAMTSKILRGQVLAALGRLEDSRMAAVVLAAYPNLESDLQPAAIDLLSQRPAWGKELLKAIEAKKVAARSSASTRCASSSPARTKRLAS